MEEKIRSAHSHLRHLNLSLTEFLVGYLSSKIPEVARSVSLWTFMSEDRRYGPAVAVERIFAAVESTDWDTTSRFGQMVIPLLHTVLAKELRSAKVDTTLRSIDNVVSDEDFRTNQLGVFQNSVASMLPCYNQIALLLCGSNMPPPPSSSHPRSVSMSPSKPSSPKKKQRGLNDEATECSYATDGQRDGYSGSGIADNRQASPQEAEETLPAERASMIIVAMALRARNIQLNRVQSLIGMLLLFQHAPASVHDMLQHLGLSVSRKTACTTLKTLNEKGLARARLLTSDPERVKVLLFDNVDMYLKTYQQSLVNPSNLLNMTMRTLLVLPSQYKQKDVSRASLLPLQAQRRLQLSQIVDEKDGQFLEQACRLQVIDALENAVYHISESTQRQRTLKLIRNLSQQLRSTRSQHCAFPAPTIAVPLPILDVNEGSIEGVIEVLENSAILLGVLKSIKDDALQDQAQQEGEGPNDTGAGTNDPSENDTVDVESASSSWADYSSDGDVRVLCRTGALGEDGVLLAVGDLKSHRNVESAQAARSHHESPEEQLSYVHSLAAPWHLLLNWVYAMFKVHFSTKLNGHEVALERYRDALRRSRSLLREEEPSFTEAWSLTRDVFAGRMQSAIQQILKRRKWRSNLQTWSPSSSENVSDLVDDLMQLVFSKSEIDKAIARSDDVGANARLFMRDAVLGFELKDSVKFGDVGRIFSVSKLMGIGFAGARRTQYLDMILDEVWTRSVLAPATWETLASARLVNRTGATAGFMGADLFQEHLNREIQRVNTSHSREGLVERLRDVFSGSAELARMIRSGHPQLFRDSGVSQKRTKGYGPDIEQCARLAEMDGLFEEKSHRVRGEGLFAARKPRVIPKDVPLAESLLQQQIDASNARDMFRAGYHYLSSRGLAAWESRRTGEDRGAAFFAAVLDGQNLSATAPDDDLDPSDVQEDDMSVDNAEEWVEYDEDRGRRAAAETLWRRDLLRYQEELDLYDLPI
ncbi:hypothetical protein CF319_g7967 [Tilletia indica]|nr:hypothetical protein CF319_g7967 [Tilletia indica]